MKLLFLSVLAIVVCAAPLIYWWTQKRRESRMISLVILLREPIMIEPAMLATAAAKVWGADLGDGTTGGADGFVVGVGPVNTIKHGARIYLVNCFPTPYAEDPEEVAKTITDLRVQRLFAQHRAWFSLDSLSVDHTTTDEELLECYRRMGKLLAEFLDENCLLIFVTDANRCYCINEHTAEALQSDDPVEALQQEAELPVIAISDDDPAMMRAVAQAREHWPRFVAAYEQSAGEHFTVKAPITYADTTEYIWLTVTAMEGDRVLGVLDNEPANLGPYKLGSKVVIALKDLNDWCYIDGEGNLQGGYTLDVIRDAVRRAK